MEAVVTHEVTVGQVQQWLELGSSNPNEEARRKRLRELMVATAAPLDQNPRAKS